MNIDNYIKLQHKEIMDADILFIGIFEKMYDLCAEEWGMPHSSVRINTGAKGDDFIFKASIDYGCEYTVNVCENSNIVMQFRDTEAVGEDYFNESTEIWQNTKIETKTRKYTFESNESIIAKFKSVMDSINQKTLDEQDFEVIENICCQILGYAQDFDKTKVDSQEMVVSS